ncbi:D-alanyl-D-alanine carboxypeptidase family protein [Cohnella sp. REN36]|uniref:D-alanyl-D-alanine carboxypeptidase family protein n=1 Tax=Cohnella sp. REN36 TaxID=2887347 RepID=UPI001D148C7E|nr:D-alanyl-D-alanine carboxypeptidase family protein [Cohnella sp. REN36]MCC3374580.1 D-alanyl-D-alanine carboxypeptidase family protein [Cohnella sp. REN36]
MRKGRLLLVTGVAALLVWGTIEVTKSDVWGSVSLSQPPASATDKPSADPAESDQPVQDEAAATPTAKPDKKPTKTPKPAQTQAPDTGTSSLAAILTENAPNKTIKTNKDGLAVVTNTSSMYVLVNKKRNLPSTYKPADLVVPDVAFSFAGDSPKKQLQRPAARALEKLFAAASEDGITLKAVSGYRSYATQKSIFDRNASLKGAEVANKTSAVPGQSEHQTGLAMDVSSASANYELEEKFASTKEGKWLAANCAEYGFIIRFLKGKEDITGYSYEPWHIRYVGKEAAKEIMKQKITLEEYLEQYNSTKA